MGEFWGLLPAGLVRGPWLCCPQGGDWGMRGSLLSCDPRGRSKTNALNISQKMIEMFVRTKHKIDKCHEFALVVVNNDATWVRGAVGSGAGMGTPPCPPHPGFSQLSGFTSDPREVCSCLYDLETVVCKSFSILLPVGLGRGGGQDRGGSKQGPSSTPGSRCARHLQVAAALRLRWCPRQPQRGVSV